MDNSPWNHAIVAAVACCLALAACGEDEPPTAPTPDTAPDGAPDAAPDTAPDTAPDAASDAIPDAIPDTIPDAIPDTIPDTAPDSASDVASDAVPDGPADKPVLDGECTAEVPCEEPSMCWDEDDDFCGMCFTPDAPCTGDGDCAVADTVCSPDPIPCACAGEHECIAACVDDAGCAFAEVCDATGHCTPKPCAGAADCPANTTCYGGACERATCTATSECDGHCVKGHCFESAGFCSPPPP